MIKNLWDRFVAWLFSWQKEESGTCCHVNDEQENAEQLTYEHHAKVGPAPKETNE